MLKRLMTVAAATSVLAACGDNGLGPGERTVSLSFTTRAPGTLNPSRQPWFSRVAAGDTIVAGQDTLIIDRVQIVLREIELERINDDACDDDSTGVDDDACEEFEIGPMLVDLPLDGSVETVITVAVDTGTYDEIEFEIHKPDDDTPEDLAFLADHPDFDGVSIRVIGSFNGTAFVFQTDLNEDQEIELATPLVITELATSTNLTMSIDLDTWFRSGTGALINPRTANKGGANENVVKDNIKDSIEAFEDDDRDGDDDDN